MGAGVFYRQGKYDPAIEWCEKSLRISRTQTDDAARRTEAHALYLLAGIYQKRGDLEHSIEAAQRAVTGYLLAGDMMGQSQALNTLANTYSEQGDFASATRCYRDSLHLKERIGDIAGQAMVTLNLGDTYRIMGNVENARRVQTQSLQIWRDLRNSYAVALLHNNLAATAVAEGNWEEADAHLVESERLFAEIGSEDFKAELQRHRAELDLGRGLIREAMIWARRSTEEAEANQAKLEIGLARRVMGKVYLAQDDLAGAERELQASLSVLESVGSSLEAASTRLALAHVRWRQGQPEAARRLVAAAIETYELVGAEALIARAQGAYKVTGGDPPAG
jgi:tetratricopeptide (TPR) repeat protein